MKKIISALVLTVMILGAGSTPVLAKGGGGGGGHSSGGGRGGASFSSGSRSVSPSRPSTASPRPTPAPRPAAPKPIPTKPSATTPKVTATTAKTVGGKTYSKTGSVVGAGYQPRFRGGYVPPTGSVVYYQNSGSDWMTWIPLMYLLSHDSHRSAVVESPATTTDGKATTTTQVFKEEGVDKMYVLNWIVTILIGAGIIGGAVYLVNKATSKKREDYE